MIGKRLMCLIFAITLLAASAAALDREEFTVAQIDIQKLEIPGNEALAFTQSLKAGWNLGNTFDAFGCTWLNNKLAYEMAWVGVRTTKQLFEALKSAGFASVRIPVSWHDHVSGEDFTIDADWLARVKEVVGYALDSGLYVIVNTHHDIEKEFIYPDEEHLDNSVRYIRSIWTQLAAAFGQEDERLMFESMNEPRLKGTSIEWWLNPSNPRSAEAVRCINALNQAFVDTVRATGGLNATRYLLVPGYSASLDGAMHKEFALPADTAENRLIVSVHAYTPYAFALQSAGESGSKSTFDPDNLLDHVDIDRLMQSLYDKFVSYGIPVVMGEFGARDKSGNLRDRADFFAYYVAAASARGIPCFVWDNNAFTGGGELFGLLDRKTNLIVYPEILESMMRYAP